MVEAKMKARRGNGTPHPKGRRSSARTLQEGHSLSDEVQPDQPKHGATKSSLYNLLSVHTQVTQTLNQIDTLVLSIHKLASSNRLVQDFADKIQDFADALASIDANLQDWNDFLKAAAERSPVSHINFEQEAGPETTPIRGGKLTDLSSDLENGAISYSPLVAEDLLECESPCSSEPLICTPLNKPRSSTSSSPLPQTPRMLSPPRSVQALATISESPLLSSPARFLASDGSQEPMRPRDLLTPEGSTCQTHLVFETPLTQTHAQLNDLSFLRTPKFGVSPPRTCRPLRPGEAVSTESDPTPFMPSPFRTPGILLDCKGVASDPGSPGIVDDLTASTVKRLGPKGLEERLWHELAIRKADILQPVKQR